jgi:geranylgeranyl diphosphate synthase type II
MTLKEAMKQAADRTGALLDRLLTPPQGIYHAKLYEAMHYSALAGGKRIRPYLVTEFCVLNGCEAEKALWYAAAIEMLHTMSLIHDDLPAMDNDVLRRGKPTNHVVFGEATAILAGDSLLCEAFSAAANNPYCGVSQNLNAVKALAEFGGTNGMMGGQQIDIQSEKVCISREVLDDLVLKKTSALISCSCVLGCIAAGADEETMQKAVDFGKYLGTAFQIKDDILDSESDEATLGKSVGKDASSGKSTYVSLLGMEKAKALAAEITDKAKKTLAGFGNSEPPNVFACSAIYC